MKKRVLTKLLTAFSVLFIATSVSADSPPPWSKVIPSQNGKYIFVMISPYKKELDEHAARLRKYWKDGNIPAENVPGAEKDLASEIAEENAIRAKYPQSGLYLRGRRPKLLWALEFYSLSGRTAVKVSNDGEHLVYHMPYISPVYGERMTPDPNEDLLTFYSNGKPLRSYKTKDLVSEKLGQGLSGFFSWCDDGVLNDKSKRFSFSKKNGEKMVFDVLTGDIISGNLVKQESSVPNDADNTPAPVNNQTSCFSAVLVLLLFSLMPKTSLYKH